MAAFSSFPMMSLPFLLMIMFSVIKANRIDGFSTDLIHRDSPLSPLYNPSNTRLDHITNAFRRSIHRVSHFKQSAKASSPMAIQSEIHSIPGEYVMKIGIGTPPLYTVAIADTGSDLSWTQCKPCKCFKQTAPFFTPSSSSTYKHLPCTSNPCLALGGVDASCSSNNLCEYSMRYGDQSFTTGDLAAETFTFSSSTSARPVSVKNVAFGCGHDNSGTFNESTSGIIGLGGGPLSIVNQMNQLVGGKFSYCLVPIFTDVNVTSTINFGSEAVVSGKDVVSTPLVAKDPDTYYYLTLESISVGSNKFPFSSKSSISAVGDVELGNIIIDSGTTLTMIPNDVYSSLESSLVEAIQGERTTNPQFALCYKFLKTEDVPTITFHFKDGDLDLPGSNTFLEVEEGISCLSVVSSVDLSIFGNLSQQNFLVGYDLVNKTVSFKPTDCTKN